MEIVVDGARSPAVDLTLTKRASAFASWSSYLHSLFGLIPTPQRETAGTRLSLLIRSHSLAMSLKAELERWAAALDAYDADDLERSLEIFSVSPAVVDPGAHLSSDE